MMNNTREKSGGYFQYLRHAGKLWYIVNPYEASFEFEGQVPDYQTEVWPSFFILIILEQIILVSKKQSTFRLNDHVTSLCNWILPESGRILCRGAEYYLYIKIYEDYRIWSLPWNSVGTWYLTALGVDFCYYWVHRANHEIHFLWAQHQVHHSSEEFNLVVGLRQSVLQQWCSFMFYLPLAAFIPPSHFIAHHQFNLIYQLWIHTTVIDDLGPLELVFNTPKHHRVHHGCNLYCLDKNYGGVLIIWDRLFGTFTSEKIKEEIIYGLVVSPRTFNPLYLQTFYTKAMFVKSLSMTSLGNKLAAFWKGPSWFPGAPRLGLDEYKVNVTSRRKYNPQISFCLKIYIIMHFIVVFYTHYQLYGEKQDCNTLNQSTIIMNNIFALTTIGLLFDKYKYAGMIELTRCVLQLYITKNDILIEPQITSKFIFLIYLTSCCFWGVKTIRDTIPIINRRQ
ncbi:alkylglycerol monooxygenase [Diachasma alloeum]|uniref:alkylglycerol monooxygenase n=1 Tax=Diachasma alloeum TaxID=454923 RepID=UPI0007382B1A|nr:alkylglycerol monooxygenase [Diachasma alloeum]XP_028982402.1 alkylglycerol monooxygenase [Diachasma alloeum]